MSNEGTPSIPQAWNADLVPRVQSPAPAGPAARDFKGAAFDQDSPPGTIAFDRIDRVAYAAPPSSGNTFPVYQVPRDITSGRITRLGIACPQIDFFGQNEYQFALDSSPPYDQLLGASGNLLGGSSFFAFVPLGTLENPKRVRINIVANAVFQIRVRPQATPAANVVVYNLFIRSQGFFVK